MLNLLTYSNLVGQALDANGSGSLRVIRDATSASRAELLAAGFSKVQIERTFRSVVRYHKTLNKPCLKSNKLRFGWISKR